MVTWVPTGHPDIYRWAVGPYRFNVNNLQFYKIVNYSDEAMIQGTNVFIGDFCLINVGERLEIGNDTAIHAHTSIIGGGTTKIGNRCSIGYYTIIVNGTDTYRKPDITQYRPQMSSALPESQRAIKRGTIIIEDEVYIGPHCTITIPQTGSDKITIGKGSVIGAYSYIDHDISPNTIIHPVQAFIWSKLDHPEESGISLPKVLQEELLKVARSIDKRLGLGKFKRKQKRA